MDVIGSIRRRALDLLYGMCDISNAKDIVEELLQVLYFDILSAKWKSIEMRNTINYPLLFSISVQLTLQCGKSCL